MFHLHKPKIKRRRRTRRNRRQRKRDKKERKREKKERRRRNNKQPRHNETHPKPRTLLQLQLQPKHHKTTITTITSKYNP